MTETQRELFERQLIAISRELEYPRTPDVAGAVMRRIAGEGKGNPGPVSRRLAWALMILLVFFASLMLIPSARAAILEFIQIGAVRIFRAEATPLPAPQQEFPSAMATVTATAISTAQPLIPILENLAGEMKLEDAQRNVDYSILLPAYPPDLGPPDRVFVQDADGAMTILVWLDPGQPDKVLMSLHFLPSGSWAVKKIEPTMIRETEVNGQRAIWTIGPYPIRYSSGDIDFTRLVDGHVLIWAAGDVTYRLETGLSLEEAVRLAESLEPLR
jgi:hypothetical protein